MSDPTLALIESNTSGTGRLFAASARARGARPVLLTDDPSRYAYAIEDGIETRRIETSDVAAVIEACRALDGEGKLAGVTSSSEYYVVTAATVARELGLSAPDPQALTRCRDKHRQRQRLAAAGVRVPRFRVAFDGPSAVAAARELGFPVVVKPTSGSGSVGVKLCATPEEVEPHAVTLLAQERNERGQPIERKILVEALVIGGEYSVETFDDRVVGVTAKHLGPLPMFVEIGHDFPASLSASDREAMASTALAALAALGLGWGPAHTELRLTADGPTIIEVNPRLAGGFIPEIVRWATGVDLVSLTVGRALGALPAVEPLRASASSIRFLIVTAEGTLGSTEGIEEAARAPNIVDARLYKSLGTPLRVHHDFRDRIGHVISYAGEPSAARHAADGALAAIRVKIAESGVEN